MWVKNALNVKTSVSLILSKKYELYLVDYPVPLIKTMFVVKMIDCGYHHSVTPVQDHEIPISLKLKRK